LVVISPQLPAISMEMRTQMKLGFDDLIKIYARFGIDLPTFDGDSSWRLPVPARLVLAKGGAVLGIEADPDYTRRPEPEETLAVLRSPG
jgi:hypothetical protein